MLNQKQLLNEIDSIKSQIISLEITLLDSEKADKDDIESIKDAVKEHKSKRTIKFQ